MRAEAAPALVRGGYAPQHRATDEIRTNEGERAWESSARAAGAVKDARLSIETVYKVSRERALALTKLDECEMWLGRCEPKETAAPTL